MFKLVLEKAEEPEIKLPHHKFWKILKEMGRPEHLTCLLKNLYAGQEGTVRTRHGTTDWFQIGKGVHQGCMLSLGLFNFYAEYIAGSQREESHPWQRSWGRKPDKMQGRDQASGVPPGISWASTPQNQSLPAYCVMLSTYSSDINRGLSPHHLFLEKVNLELLDNKSPGHNKSVSIPKLLWWLSSLLAGLLQPRMWLFAASRLREAQEAYNILGI